MAPVIDAVGYLASLGAACMWLPQTIRAFRLRHSAAALEGLSLSAYAVAVVFNALLLTYGTLEHARPVQVAGTLNLLCAAVIVGLLLARRPAR